MKYCNKCGTGLKGHEKFCRKCGSRLERIVETSEPHIQTYKKQVRESSSLKIFWIIISIIVVVGVIFFGSYYIYNQKQLISRQKAEITQKEQEAQREAREKQSAQVKAQRKQEELDAERERQRVLNEDKDGDGLTFAEEQKLGTSDDDEDSDGDNILDNMDTNPTGGGRHIAKQYEWDFGGYTHTWTVSIHSDWYDYYKNLPRFSNKSIYVTPYDEEIKDLSERLENKAKELDLNVVGFMASFVQNLPYLGDEYTGFDDYRKYPIEMLIDDNGDCEDSSYLLASLLRVARYGVVLINPPEHMMIGVLCSNCEGSYYEHNGKKYYVLETTNPGWELGEMPEGYNKAKIIEI